MGDSNLAGALRGIFFTTKSAESGKLPVRMAQKQKKSRNRDQQFICEFLRMCELIYKIGESNMEGEKRYTQMLFIGKIVSEKWH